MEYGKFLTLDRVNRIRASNKNKSRFIQKTAHGCEICFLTYYELQTGEKGVCELCYAKAQKNASDSLKPIRTKF